MKYTTIKNQILVWKSTPLKVPVERNLEEVDNSLSPMPTNLLGGSLCPKYSTKQLRKIKKLQKHSKRRFDQYRHQFKNKLKENKNPKYIKQEMKQCYNNYKRFENRRL